MNGLRYIRIRCNISISELAEEIGVSRQALSSWENGRKDIPAQRSEQLADFFGIDPKYLGEITDAEKKELLEKAMFRYEEQGRETYRYKPKEGTKTHHICFPPDSTISLDERYDNAKKKKQAVLKQAQGIIRWTDRAGNIESQISCINRGCEVYGLTNQLMEHMREQEAPLQMPFYYEMIDIWKAMHLAYDMMEENELTAPANGGIKCGEDVEWIVGLSKEFREHWDATAKQCREWLDEKVDLGGGAQEASLEGLEEQIREAEKWNHECADGKYRSMKVGNSLPE